MSKKKTDKVALEELTDGVEMMVDQREFAKEPKARGSLKFNLGDLLIKSMLADNAERKNGEKRGKD